VGETIQRAPEENGLEILDGRSNASQWQRTTVHSLRRQVVLLAMKHGRAPLSVSSALWKSLRRLGAPNNLYELGGIARRLSFLGDSRILLAELRHRIATSASAEEPVSEENQIGVERRP
jgi:hypothetical protein